METSLELYAINKEDLRLPKDKEYVLDTGPFSTTTVSSFKLSKRNLAVRNVNTELNEEQSMAFNDLCIDLLHLECKCMMPISYIILPDIKKEVEPAICTPFYPDRSLKEIITRVADGEEINQWDPTQQMITFYGIATFLKELHDEGEVHGRLRATNVFLDDDFRPLVSDSLIYKMSEKEEPVANGRREIGYIVSLAPETLNSKKYSNKTDIYNFGIIMLQVLTGQINVYYNKGKTAKEIRELIEDGELPTIPDSKLSKLIKKCLNSKPKKRPDAQEILEEIDSVCSKKGVCDKKRFAAFKEFLNNEEVMEANVRKYKRNADKGKTDMMYEYGRARFNGEGCTKDEEEALRYLRLASEKGHEGAKELFDTIMESYDEIQMVDEEVASDSEAEEGFIKLIDIEKESCLKDDPFFKEEKLDIKKVVADVKAKYLEKDQVDFEEEDLRKKNFIFTPGARERLTKLCRYIDAGVPVLLEGPTGTSKTLSTEIVCELLGRKLIRFNLSSETKSTDLLGRYVGDPDSWAGISLRDGAFIIAFTKGYTLLLDEINLASQECLQFIEDTIDSGVISIEIPGKPLKEIRMHPEFRLIATQNPNKGLFAHKRQDLGIKFLSRFQVINFPAFTKDELLKIAEGLAIGFKYKGSKTIIENLIDFHMKWSELPEIKEDVQCFTVREIAAVVRALADGENPYDTVMTIYGARYQKEKKGKLDAMLRSYRSFAGLKSEPFKYPDGFPNCYQNDNLSQTLKSILFSFKNHRHVIITANEGSGITQISRWIANWYDSKNGESSKKEEYFCVCTEETKCSDLIGSQKPSTGNKETHELIEWKDGFLTSAIIKGKCAVLDSLDEAPATVTERLNALLDQKYDGQEKMFEVPENPKNSQIKIDPNFRLLCTCNIDKINQMSPAFVNRFDVIVLENQLEGITQPKLKELIKLLLSASNIEVPHKGEAEPVEKDEFDDGFEDCDIEEEDHDEGAGIIKLMSYVEPSSDMINYISSKFDPKKSTMLQLSLLCKAATKYSQYFPSEEYKYNEIIDFSCNILNRNQDFVVPKKFEDYLISHLKKQERTDDSEFFFEGSPLLKQFIAKLYAASLISLPVCVYGPTGAGKTSAARAFARIRPISSKNPLQMHSFHAGTKPNHYYGTTTLKEGAIHFIHGTLTTALTEGSTFIADEMNLSPISNMKALAPALEPCVGQQIFIPGVGETIRIHKNFFFVACQNELGTIGRNAIPPSIASRFRYFDYPKQEVKDVSNICYDISKSLYFDGEKPSFTEAEARNIGKYMIELNKLKQRVIPQWSLRDITKLFQRIHHQDMYKTNFINMSVYHNVLFYTLSPVNDEDIPSILPVVCNLIGDSFSLSAAQRTDLQDSYLASPTVQTIEGKTFIMKGKSGIYYENTSSFSLPSLLNGVFQVLLSDSAEPILFMGASGFKTFLAQQFLSSAKVITLNQESTVAQLLGSSAFLTDSEAKIFYLETICKICHMYNNYQPLKQKLEKGELKKEEIEKYTKAVYDSLPDSFQYSINHLTQKLFDESTSDQDENALSNIKLEFRPGLFLSAILEGRSLILKNLHNLPTIILERFNELFSGKHNLTLNEDIHNTFTNENKELTNFSANFRVFATCPPNSATKLSEAVLSRFTVIHIPEYKSTEKINVLKSYISLNVLKFNDSLISLLINFSETMKAQIGRAITFPQMINIIEMCSRLNKNTTQEENWINNLGIIVFRVAMGLLENRKKLAEKMIKIFGELRISLPEHFKIPLNEDPLKLDSENGFQGIRSKITGFFIKSPTAKEAHQDIAFIPMLNEMIDIVHLGLVTNIPVIFEGMPGQGKQTAIKYLCESLGYNIINIIISQSTKVEDLLGKVTIARDEENKIHVKIIETKLVKSFRSSADSSNSVIVFHNINNASPAVLEVLVSIFDQHQTDILLPDGSTIEKRNVNIIGIFNPQNGLFNRDRLPSNLISSSIYHIVNKPKNQDVLRIIETLFASKPFKLDAKPFFDKYQATKKLITESGSQLRLTLNDIKKYVIFRDETFKYFDETTISQMIFAYRFVQQETIQQVLKSIGVGDMKFNPTFSYNKASRKIFIKVSKDAKEGITHSLYSDEIDTDKIQSILTCLTLPQKHCLLFLLCSLLSKRTCIVQGSTASGKSHIIRLFAKMFGQKLNVYQMNSETGISILTGQSVLENELNTDDLKVLNEAKADLAAFKELSKFVKTNFPSSPKDWKPNQFNILLDEIKKYKEDNPKLESSKKHKLSSIEKRIKQTILPANRFKHAKSSFINAMTNGEWILIDGIESAPAEIAEKISTLCGDDPELDLCECGEGFYFTRKDLPNSKRIHDNFHLFVTYNPTSQAETKTLDPSFTNKCVSFTLPPMDSTIEYSAQILLGSLIRLSYSNEFALEVGARIAMMHSIAKMESDKDRDSFAGDMQFTGRTLKFITKEFELHVKNNKANPLKSVYKPICNSMQEFYMNSYINQGKESEFHQKLVNEFAKSAPGGMILDCIGMNPKDRNKELLKQLRNVQLYATSALDDSKFSFPAFTQKCMSVLLSDVPFVVKHLRDTVKIIEENCNCSDAKYSNIYENEYPQIKILLRIFEDINAGMAEVRPELTGVPLRDDELLTGELEKPLSRLNLLTLLQSDDTKYMSLKIPSLIFNETIHKIMQTINDMVQKPSLKLFGSLVSELAEHKELFTFIDSIFPYNRFNDTSFSNISYWLPMFLELHKAETTFHVIVNDVHYHFEYYDESDYQPSYIFNEEDELILSPKSCFTFMKAGKKYIPTYSIKEDIERDLLAGRSPLFYGLTLYFIKNPKHITQTAFRGQFSSCREFPVSPRENQYAQFSLLFNSIKQKTSLIAKVWAIVYTFPIELINILKVFLHPLEEETLISVFKLFAIIGQKSVKKILDFTKSLEKFGSEDSILWRVMNNTFSLPKKNDLERGKALKKQIKSEIQKLKDTPIISEEIWSPKQYIRSLTEVLNQIDDYVQSIINSNQDLRIRQDLRDLVDQLNNIEITKTEYANLRNHIIQQIEKIKEKAPTKENFEICQKQVNKFKETIASISEKSAQNNIMWPTYNPSEDVPNVPTNTMKLYMHVIWYSRVSNIYNKILDKKNKNIMESVILLNEFPELQSVAELLISRLMNAGKKSGSGIIPEDIDVMKATLNAHFIKKLVSDDIFSEITELDSIFNELTNRKAITDEREFVWIHKIASQFPPDFNLILPHFSPNDLFFLLLSYKGDEVEPSFGPLVHNRSNDIAISLKRYIFNKQESFKSCTEFIVKKIYRMAFECTEEEVPTEMDKIKNNIKLLPDRSDFRVALAILKIGKRLESIPKFKLTFDDIELLNPKWISNEAFVTKYPSLVYWLSKNLWCTKQIQTIYEGSKFEEDKLPFWLFAVRMMSAKNCVTFTSKSQTALGVLIRNTINKEVQSRIKKVTESLGTDWLNILLPTLPNEIVVHEYKMFYNFFINLSEEADSTKLLIQGEKEKEIKKFTQNICKMVFSGNAKDLLSSKLGTKNDDLAFLKDPKEVVSSIIKGFSQRIYDKFLSSIELKDLNEYHADIDKKYVDLIEHLDSSTDEEIKNKKEKMEKEKKDNSEKEIEKYRRDLTTTIYEYKKKLELLSSNETMNYTDLSRHLFALFSLQEKIKTSIMDYDAKPLDIIVLEYNRLYDTKIQIRRIDGDTKIIQLESGSGKRYFRGNIYSDESIKKCKFLQSAAQVHPTVTWRHEWFYPIKDRIDPSIIDEICSKKVISRTFVVVPSLLFCNRIGISEMIDKLKDVRRLINNAIKEINSDFKSNKANDGTFRKPYEVITTISSNTFNMEVKFSNGDRCPNIQAILDEFLRILNQYKANFQKIHEILQNDISPKWKQIPRLGDSSIFTNHFELPLPETEDVDVSSCINFRNIRDADFLSSPILTAEKDGSIFCCFSSLRCSIGPIIPSMYSKNITMNFVSFIEEEISIDVETDEKHKDWFKGKRNISPGDNVQIFISLPIVEGDDVIKEKIDTVIKVTSPKLKELSIPCKFKVKLLPLSILLSCDEYPIARQDDKYILCTNRVLSDSKITFSIQNFNIKEDPTYCYQLSSFDDNQAIQPEVNLMREDHKLQLQVPPVKVATRIHFALKIAFTEHFSIEVIIDSVIVPFVYSFDIYDYIQSRYVSNSVEVPYSMTYSINRPFTLRCRIYSPCFSSAELSGTIRDVLPSYVTAKYNGISCSFRIKENTDFEIDLIITKPYHIIQTTNLICVKINGIESTINIQFKEVFPPIIWSYSRRSFNQNYLSQFNVFKFKNNTWDQVRNSSESTEGVMCVVGPFHAELLETPFVSYAYSSCEIKNARSNYFVCMNEKGEYSREDKYSIKDKDKSWYATIWSYSIAGVSKGQWYPFYKEYPINFNDWKILDVKKENINIAESRFRSFQYYISGFYSLANTLKKPSVIKTFGKFYNDAIDLFEKVGYADEFLEQIDFSNVLNADDKKLIIISHNIVSLLFIAFRNRYNEISKKKFFLTPDELNFNEKVEECYRDFLSIKRDPYYYNDFSRKFIDFENAIKKIKVTEFPSKPLQEEAFLITENTEPVPRFRKDLPEFEDTIIAQVNKAGDKEIKVALPKIKIPDETKFGNFSILTLNELYNNCIQGTRILPIFIRNMKIQTTRSMEREAMDYITSLVKIYNVLPEKDCSIISASANAYRQAFASMAGKFKKAGIDISSVLKIKCSLTSDDAVQDFIQYPEKDKPFLPMEEWTVKENESITNLAFTPNIIQTNVELMNVLERKDDVSFENLDSGIKSKEETPTKIEDHPVSSETDDIEFRKIIFEVQKKIGDDDESDDDKDDGFEDHKDPEKKDDPKVPKAVIITEDSTHTKTVKSEQFDGMVSHFTESEGIERAIARMKEIDKLHFSIPEQKPYRFHREYLEPDIKNYKQENYSIVPLIEQSYFISQEFIKIAADQDIPFSNIAVNILVDCSSYISDENKIFNMLLICALTNALTAIEVPYSAAVVADQNFRSIIKSFDEPHSFVVLQRICDCLLIKRYRTKLASAAKFAIDHMRFNTDRFRNQRAIFTFSDGLDEQLVLTKSWADIILNDPNISFGYVFIESTQLKNENLAFVENVWKKFEIDTKNKGARSGLKVAPIKAELSSDVLRLLGEMFSVAMKRPESVVKRDVVYEKVRFNIDNALSNLESLKGLLKMDYHSINGVYAERTTALDTATSTLDKLDTAQYRNLLMNIAACKVDDKLKKEDIYAFIKEFIESRRRINQAALESIFKPNKASQTVLSTTGTDFDITALILNLINPVPDPLIYLEEKGGLIRNYGVSVVIDPSISCFHDLSGSHTFQTIKVVLSYLASLDLPCFDLIVAGNSSPTVLCSEVGTLRALSSKSSLWESIFAVLQNPLPKADLTSAIHAAFDLRRMRSTEYTSILLVLTDGLYQESERKGIRNCINNCVQSGMSTIGIGVGIYPKGITKLFPQVVFSPNPLSVMKGVATFFGDNSVDQLSSMPSISISQPESAKIKAAIKSIVGGKPVFARLVKELHDIRPSLDAFDDMYNEEQNVGNDKDGYFNPTGKNTELYTKNLLKSQKILIVMLWDCTMSKNEEKFVHKDYIFKSSEPGKTECIKTAVDHFGIELVVVQNYEAAINELTRQTKSGCCDYYATWVMCGPPYPVLPEKEKGADPHLVGQFNEVLIKFWKNGGSIVFWAEGDPLTYQVNLFLETVRFSESECPSGITQLRIGGEHKGTQILLGSDSGDLSKPKTFNRSPQIFKEVERTTISHNLGKIFEGITISYAQYNESIMKPFKPFSRDSDGGVSSLFYCANSLTGTGDIIIDCGYTKCFTKMTTDGTFRYVQNIAGWTARPEVHMRNNPGTQPRNWRPKAVSHSIRRGEKWTKFKEIPKPPVVEVDVKKLRTLWAIDCSGSVQRASLYHNELRKIVSEYYKPGDDIWLWDSSTRHITYSDLQSFMNNMDGWGGTESSLIADIAKASSFREHLLIVTDGCVNGGSIDRSDQKMISSGIRFKAVTTFVIGTGGDLSVGAPYSRGCQNKTFEIRSAGEPRKLISSLNSQDLKALNDMQTISNYSQFISYYSNLEMAIQAKTLGTTGDATLKSQLSALYSRVTRSGGMNSSQSADFESKYNVLYGMADGRLRDTFSLDSIAAAKRGLA